MRSASTTTKDSQIPDDVVAYDDDRDVDVIVFVADDVAVAVATLFVVVVVAPRSISRDDARPAMAFVRTRPPFSSSSSSSTCDVVVVVDVDIHSWSSRRCPSIASIMSLVVLP